MSSSHGLTFGQVNQDFRREDTPCCQFKKINLIITGVALVALTAVVIGALALLANLPSEVINAGPFNQIGLIGGAALSGFGVITCIALIIVSTVRYCRSKSANENAASTNEFEPTTSSLFENQRADYTTYERPNDYRPNGYSQYSVSHVSDTAYFNSNSQVQPEAPVLNDFLNEVLEELQISDLDQHLSNIYGKNLHPKLPAPPANSKDYSDYYTSLLLYLRTNDEILNFELNAIANFKTIHLNILFMRLVRMDKEVSSTGMSAAQDVVQILTLGDLRTQSLRAMINSRIEIPTVCWAMLTAAQIESVLNDLDEQSLSLLLPTDEVASNYTEGRLSQMDIKLLFSVVLKLSGEQLRLLPLSYFQSPDFPWTDLITMPVKVRNFLTIENYSKKQKTRSILQQLDIIAIQVLAPVLTAEHLSLFSEKQLKDEQFPWAEFFQKKGIGHQMRGYLSSAIFSLRHIPWEKLSEKSEEIKNLFTVEDYQKKYKTRSILQELDIQAILVLSPVLTAEHLSLFSEKQRENEKFPWAEFFKKQGIGHQMREYLSFVIFSVRHIPWIKLSEKSEEIKSLFTIEDYQKKQKTRSLLQELDIQAILALAPALTAEHLPLFSEKQLKDEQFPWAEFFKKQGIGDQIRRNLSILPSSLPWASLDPTEISKLLSISNFYREKEQITKILDSVDLNLIKQWARAGMITSQHIDCLSQARKEEYLKL